jgi:hypothetical protein
MSFSTTPPTARTDVQAMPRSRNSGLAADRIRLAGAVLAVGAVAWAVAVAFVGFDPDTEAGVLANNLTGLLFQCGLLALVQVHLATRATGTKRINRWMLQTERVLLVLAIAWTACHALLPSQRDATWLAVLDFAWPLSMLGMFLIGVKIGVKGRWRGPARAWSLIAETWVLVTMPALGILGQTLGTAVGVAHLLLGYAVLGLILALRPDLVEDRD